MSREDLIRDWISYMYDMPITESILEALHNKDIDDLRKEVEFLRECSSYTD